MLSSEIRQNCKFVADEIDLYSQDDKCLCPCCENILTWESSNYDPAEDKYTCTECFYTGRNTEFELITIRDLLAIREFSNTSYRLDDDGNYIGVQFRIETCFDEFSIFVDTEKEAVCTVKNLEYIEYGLTRRATESLNAFFEDKLNAKLFDRVYGRR
jgi:hypothetical protein